MPSQLRCSGEIPPKRKASAMSSISRRDLLYSGVALSASSLLVRSAWSRTAAMLADAAVTGSPAALAAIAPREQLLFDFGWKFQFGHGTDPARDLGSAWAGGFCEDRRLQIFKGKVRRFEVAGARSAPRLGGGTAVCTRRGAKFARVQAAGAAVSGDQRGLVPAEFEIPSQRSGRRITVEFDGAFRSVLVFVNGCFIGRSDNGYAPFRFDLTDFLPTGRRTTSRCAWMRALATAGFMRAPASTGMCG
jgi:beta-galactosidase